MPDYLPTITTQTNPIISAITSVDTSYAELQASMGTFVYQLESMYVYSSNQSQLLQPILLKKKNAQGDRNSSPLILTIDPFQYTGAINKDMIPLDYRFDGNNNFYVNILANTEMDFVIDVTQLSAIDLSENIKDEVTVFENDFYKEYEIDF